VGKCEPAVIRRAAAVVVGCAIFGAIPLQAAASAPAQADKVSVTVVSAGQDNQIVSQTNDASPSMEDWWG
jgi:streptogramin lyase